MPAMLEYENKVREIRSFDLQRLKQIWEELESVRLDLPVFAGFAWHRCWWETVGSHQPQCNLSCLEIISKLNGATIGLVPLMNESYGHVDRLVSHSSPYADYFDIVCRPGDERQCCIALHQYFSAAHRSNECVELFSIRADSETARALEQVFPKSCISFSPGRPCPVIDLHHPDILHHAVGKRTTILKKNRLERLGDLQVKHLRSTEEIAPYFDHFTRWHEQRWREHRLPVGLFSDPDVRRFFRALMVELPKRKNLVVSALLLDEVPLAFCWGLSSSKSYAYYRSAFDPVYTSYSPGTVLLEEVIKSAAQWGLEIFDFLRGAYAFKYRYANREVVTVDVKLHLQGL